MDFTTNYNLKKPAITDNYDIANQNSNMDIIDAELKANATTIANKETPDGAQMKATTAEANAKNYASGLIGTLGELATTIKTNIVASINELKNELSTHASDSTIHVTAEIARFKSGTGIFTTRGSEHTVVDAFCTAASDVRVNITGSIKPQGIWAVDSQDGQFVITSDRAETADITFDYAIVKGGI